MKKFLSVALAAVMMLSLAACGSSSNKAESSSEGGSASDKTYIIATDTTFAPFEFTNDKNEFVGIDVDILAAIAKDKGFKYDLQSLGFDAAVAALESGQGDGTTAQQTSQSQGLPVCLSQKKDRKNMTSPKLTMIPMYVWL